MGTSRTLSGVGNSLSKIYSAIGSSPAEIKATGLRYVADKQPGISCAPDGEAFHDVASDGHVVEDEQTLTRIKSLGIPPAHTDARVCRSEDGYLQATGHDAKSRKQYRHHPHWRATQNEHVEVEGATLHFHFVGKSGEEHTIDVRDRRLTHVVQRLRDLPGQEVFQYTDDDGARHTTDSSDVNDFLNEITGEHFTAKDFRTWAGTVLASLALQEFEAFDSATQAKRNVTAAIKSVAQRLGNTPAICRKCYVHPGVLDIYLDGTMLHALEQWAE